MTFPMITETDYYGWKALALGSADAQIIIPLEIGPRVVFCGVPGGDNLFHNVKEELGGKNEPEWHLRGGHRLWHSPEAMPRTYDPDNFPIEVTRFENGKGFKLAAPQADPSGMLKSITIEMISDTTFKLTHRLTNKGQWPVECAPWGLTVLERGGYSTIPLLPKGDHTSSLLPNYSLVPWTYTDLSKSCWDLKTDYIGIKTWENDVPQKLGITNYPGWAAYWQAAGTFVKYAAVDSRATYPDFGCAYETFCNDFMIELETLGPLKKMEADESVEHIEYWGVFKDLPKPDSDDVFSEDFRPAIDAWLETL